MIGVASTGSGKTLTFGMYFLSSLLIVNLFFLVLPLVMFALEQELLLRFDRGMHFILYNYINHLFFRRRSVWSNHCSIKRIGKTDL